MQLQRIFLSSLTLLFLLALSACNSSSSGDAFIGMGGMSGTGGTGAGVGTGGTGAGVGTGGTGAGVGTGGTAATGGTTGCASSATSECSDCIDNDGDGKVDGFDPECISSADDDEGSYATGIPGDNKDETWQDCFFDGNSGAGDDDCRYNTCCLIGGCEPGSEQDSCTNLSQACVDFCGGSTVPGCDCFGCCTMCDDAGCVDVVVNPTAAPDCTYADIHDPAKCPTCQPSTECGSACGCSECVLCPGQLPDDLCGECGDTQECPNNAASCTSDADCTDTQYCSAFCCVEQIIVQ